MLTLERRYSRNVCCSCDYCVVSVFECALLRNQIWTKWAAVSSPLLLFQCLLSDSLCGNCVRKLLLLNKYDWFDPQEVEKLFCCCFFQRIPYCLSFYLFYLCLLVLIERSQFFLSHNATVHHLWKEITFDTCLYFVCANSVSGIVVSCWLNKCLSWQNRIFYCLFYKLLTLCDSQISWVWSCLSFFSRALSACPPGLYNQPVRTHSPSPSHLIFSCYRPVKTPWLSIYCIILCYLFPISHSFSYFLIFPLLISTRLPPLLSSKSHSSSFTHVMLY